MKEAIMAGMVRGFNFKDFLEKNVYAIPYGNSYSLVTSIDYARKVGMRSGIVGIMAPTYQYKKAGDVEILSSCSVTVKRKVGEYIGEYTALVDFNELKSAKNIDELKKIWSEIPAKAKVKLENLKNEIKLSYENTKI